MDRARFVLQRLLPALALLALAGCARPPADDAGRKARIFKLFVELKKDFPDAPEMLPDEAVALWREGRLLPIDVRTPAERSVSTLPGAVTEEAYLADPTLAAGKRPLVYCTIGYRSGLVVESLAKRGFPVVNLVGGILGWIHAGGALVDAQGQPTKRVHVYGPSWNMAPNDYTAVW